MDISKVAQNIIKCVATGELDAHNVRLCGVGLEELGLEEFQRGNFFTGELYLDQKQQCYKDLGFKRYNAITVIGGLAAKETRVSMSTANSKGIKGNLRGDGMLNGGMLIVMAGGKKVLLSHKQSSPGDHVSNKDILEVLGIKADQSKEDEGPAASPGEADCGCATKDAPQVEEGKH